jgi:hypothetical protein
MKTAIFLVSFTIVSILADAQTTLEPLNSNTTKTKIEKEAQFPGGPVGWRRYLERNLNANIPNNDHAPEGKYEVKVQFIVDKEGNVSNVAAVSAPSLCPSCAAEAVRVIRMGPKWVPATQGGSPVNYEATQFVTFQVRNDTVRYGSLPSGPPLIKFRDISLRDALQEAGETGKIVFAQFSVKDCERCDETADIAFASKALAATVSGKCIPVRITINSSDRVEFIKKFNPYNRLGTFFISPDGELLNLYPRTSTRPEDYIAELEKALSKQMEGRVTLKELDEEWNANPKNFVAMELNLERRQSFGWYTDALLNTYVTRLPTDSIKSARTLTFIASMAPSLFSQANFVLRKDNALFSQVWSGLPQPKRVDINRRVIAKSIGNAIAARNLQMAESVARFTASTYRDEAWEKAQQGYDKQMMAFFRGIRDTTTYLQKAVAYYDNYYMTVDMKQVLKSDSIARKKALDTARVEKIEDPLNKGRFINTRRITVMPQAALIANDLMQAAQSIYSMTNDQAYLQKGIMWATRAIDLYQFADMNGVLAKILYVKGDKVQAIAMQKETIKKLQQVRGKSVTQQATLELMQADKKLTDRVAY